MEHSDLPSHLNLRSTEPMGIYDANCQRPAEQYDTVFNGDEYQVYYDKNWWYLSEYLLLDPKTRTLEDGEILLKALQSAASTLAHRAESVGIGPDTEDVLEELLQEASGNCRQPGCSY